MIATILFRKQGESKTYIKIDKTASNMRTYKLKGKIVYYSWGPVIMI